jgi:flagellar hook-basal body complex protein FliE
MNGIREIIAQRLRGAMSPGGTSPAKRAPEGFRQVLRETLGSINDTHLDLERMVREFSTGELQDIHRLMIELEKASVGLEFVIEVRNKLVEAYQEIMRMQV